MRGEAQDRILNDILWGTQSPYFPFFSRDEQPHTFTRYPSAYGVNSDLSSLHGEHWVAFYHVLTINLECFTHTAALPTRITFRSHSLSLIYINSHQLLCNNSSDCGQACIFISINALRIFRFQRSLRLLVWLKNPDLYVLTLHSKLRSLISLCSFDQSCCNTHSYTPKHH